MEGRHSHATDTKTAAALLRFGLIEKISEESVCSFPRSLDAFFAIFLKNLSCRLGSRYLPSNPKKPKKTKKSK
jgi:hypothetical protein